MCTYATNEVNLIIPTDAGKTTPSLAGGASWRLTGQLSPRPHVRVATVDAYGQPLNQYTRQQLVDAQQPDAPWATYLADATGRYRLICFDLDAKTPAGRDQAAVDADRLTQLLTDQDLDVVVCASGPTGGRHVWTAVVDGADPGMVAQLARLARHLCPTVDLAPLSNPATGCVRPPGAPHRAGGRSTVLHGDLEALTAPRGTAAQLVQVVEAIAQQVATSEPMADVDPGRPLPLDDHGRLYLPGPRRPLPAPSQAAVAEDAAAGDASAVLWRVLIGAAASRWHHADVAALVATSPGLEHVRSYRDRGRRIPRSAIDAERLLRRQWDKAVRYVATHPRQAGDDPTFDDRAGAIAAQVRQLQDAAQAAAGRWSHGGGPADRRILDVLCVLALQSLQGVVEADTRRLAQLAGCGRETARVALYRLAADGWITRTDEAHGCHGARWALGTFHSSYELARSQADPRAALPRHTGAAERTAQLAHLLDKTAAAAHDAFTPGPGLGLHAGNVYAATTTDSTTHDVARTTGTSEARAQQDLTRLAAAGLIRSTKKGWRRRGRAALDRAATQRGVDGRLDERKRRYAVERELWAWYQAEEAWMRAPQRPAASRRPQRGQLSLIPQAGTHAYGPHPRRSDGTLDWRAARHVVENERGGTAQRRGATPAGRQYAQIA